MINWGILGAGRIAEKFVSDFNEIESGKVVAVASRDKAKSQNFATQFSIEKAFASYQDLVSNPDVDIIYIATPHNFHYEQCKLCLEHGKNVLCEKPITVNANQLKELMVLAKRQGVFLMEAMWTPFLPAILKAQQWVGEGQIGAIKAVYANFGFISSLDKKERLFNPNLAGGSLLDIGIYPLTLFEMFAESEIEQMQCMANMGQTGIDETLQVQLKYKNGVFAQMQSSIVCDLNNEAVIYGEHGKIIIPEYWMSKKAYLYTANPVETFEDKSQSWGYNHEIEAINKDLMAGKIQNELVPLARSLKMLELMDEIRKSIGLKYPFESHNLG